MPRHGGEAHVDDEGLCARARGGGARGERGVWRRRGARVGREGPQGVDAGVGGGGGGDEIGVRAGEGAEGRGREGVGRFVCEGRDEQGQKDDDAIQKYELHSARPIRCPHAHTHTHTHAHAHSIIQSSARRGRARTHADKVEHDAPALGRALRRVRPEAAKVEQQDEEEPEAQRALRVRVARLGQLELGRAAGDEAQQGWRLEEREDVQLEEQDLELARRGVG